LQAILLLAVAVISGAVAAIFVLPALLPSLSDSISGTSPKVFWYLSRASAMVSYLLLWLSMVLGLGITNRLAFAWPGGPTTYSLHQYTGLLGLGFALLHPLLLLGDQYINYTLAQVAVPFAGGSYRPLSVAFGQLAIYLLAVVGLSYYARKLIATRWWRILHALSFLTFLLIIVHGITAGTDSTGRWVITMYWVTGASVVFLSVYRVLQRRLGRVQVARNPR
jgi:predicted ferric reductase